MKGLLANVSIQVNENIYLKDPETSNLGIKIIRGSIDLIEEMGFEAFTFRKLGIGINSNEASIYRYFESKHKVLLYLTSWYWSWMEYRLVFAFANVESPLVRLEKAIKVLTEEVVVDGSFDHINEIKLHRIVIRDSSKAYSTKDVDEENKAGLFVGYKTLVARVSNVINEINPTYKYPHMLVSTIMEGANHQHYFAEHLPRLTDIIKGEDAVVDFYKQMVIKAIT